MAVYHFTLNQKGAGGSGAVLAAAYRHAAKMTNERTGITKSYRGKDEVVHTEIALPKDAPAWARDRYSAFIGDNYMARSDVAKVSETLWNDVESANIRLNRRPDKLARFATSLEMSLPVELSRAENVAVARSFVEKNLTSQGMIADWVYHDLPDNPHVHILATVRELGPSDWGDLRRDWNGPGFIRRLRMSWAHSVNTGLEQAGLDVRVDHRSYRDQGLELEKASYDRRIAENIERGGGFAMAKERALAALKRNEQLLRERPAHILLVLGAEKTVFTADEIKGAFARRVNCGPDELESLVESAMTSPELVALSSTGVDGSPLFSTKARLAGERVFMAQSARMAGERLAVSDEAELSLLSPSLGEGQARAARAMLSGQKLTLVTGYAGAGKTYTVEQVAQVWAARGYEVLGGAVSGKATQELSKIKHLNAASLASWNAQWARGRSPRLGKFVFIMDEAGMAGTDAWARVQAQVHKMGGKFIAVGDPEQLQPVGDVSPFVALQDQIGVQVIDTVVRQETREDRNATKAFAQGGSGVTAALQHYADKGAVRFAPTTKEASDALVRNYLASDLHVSDKVALALSNKDVWRLNDALRAGLIANGQLDATRGALSIEISRIDNFQDTRDAQQTPLQITVGERLLFTATHREHGIPKSTLCEVVDLRPDTKEIYVTVDGGSRSVAIDLNAFSNFDYGYAVTTHKAQGMSVGRSYVLAHPYMNRHWTYVAMSRHKAAVELHVGKDRFGDLTALVARAQASGQLTLADSVGPEIERRRMGHGVGALATISDRLDARLPQEGWAQTDLLGDTHLSVVAQQTAGLLSSTWTDDQSPFVEDHHIYEADPTQVLTDLGAIQSTYTASDIAQRLSSVVRCPDTFIRMFEETMAHPDLVILSEEGDMAKGRVYTTKGQLELEAAVVDQGVAMHLEGAERAALNRPSIIPPGE